MTAITDMGVVPELTLGLRLELARRQTGMTQPQLAEELGISKRTVVDFENDVRAPKRATMMGWARATGVSFAWLETGQAANPEGGGLRVVRHQGLEPRTRCLSVSSVPPVVAVSLPRAA